jgi:hypothetical protein
MLKAMVHVVADEIVAIAVHEQYNHEPVRTYICCERRSEFAVDKRV